MARDDAAPLITLADKIHGEGPCAQARDIRALQQRMITLVNAHKIPRALQETLSSGVNALVVQTPPCLPAIPETTTERAPPIVIPEHGKNRKHKHGDQNDGGGD